MQDTRSTDRFAIRRQASKGDFYAVIDNLRGLPAMIHRFQSKDLGYDQARDIANVLNGIAVHNGQDGVPATFSFDDIPLAVRQKRSRILMQVQISDLKRWSDPRNLPTDGGARARHAAERIAGGVPVIDLGCGRMQLENLLAEGCTYLPADIVARDERTIIVDLNSGEYPDVEADVVTALDLFEYIHNPGRLFANIARRWPRLVMTYNVVANDPASDLERHSRGWLSALSRERVVALANETGWRCDAILSIDEHRLLFDLSRV